MTERFSASVASRLEICPGSGNLDLAIPGWKLTPRDQMAGAAGRGTWMHDILAWVCAQSEDDRGTYVEILRDFAQLGYRKRDLFVTDEDEAWKWLDERSADAIPADLQLLAKLNHGTQVYVDAGGDTVTLSRLAPKELRFMASAVKYFDSVVFKIGTQNLHQEEKVTITWLDSHPRTTADVVVWDGEELAVIDWKTGAIPVEAQDNTQLVFYAGAWINRVPASVQEITVHIVQPGNTSSWTFTREHLMQRIKELREAEAKVLNKDLTLVPSDSCTFCPAYPQSRGDKGSPLCPAALRLLYPPAPIDEAAILGDL